MYIYIYIYIYIFFYSHFKILSFLSLSPSKDTFVQKFFGVFLFTSVCIAILAYKLTVFLLSKQYFFLSNTYVHTYITTYMKNLKEKLVYRGIIMANACITRIDS